MTVKEFYAFQKIEQDKIDKIEARIREARKSIQIPEPDKLRPATPDDLVQGRIIYRKFHSIWEFDVIDEILTANPLTIFLGETLKTIRNFEEVWVES